MGTDIHGRLQYRWSPGEQYQDAGEIERERNYRVFAMLAGVRNAIGFAGVRTHEPLEPIAPPRGLPPDFQAAAWGEENPKFHNEAYFGDHSFSWVTLKEILDWPGWDRDLAMHGVLDRAEYERVVACGDCPVEWSGGVWGQDVLVVDAADVRNGTADPAYTHVAYAWSVPFRDSAHLFRLWLDYVEAKYGRLVQRDPAAVRLVFGFDS